MVLTGENSHGKGHTNTVRVKRDLRAFPDLGLASQRLSSSSVKATWMEMLQVFLSMGILWFPMVH